jgi:hypothetical protein
MLYGQLVGAGGRAPSLIPIKTGAAMGAPLLLLLPPPPRLSPLPTAGAGRQLECRVKARCGKTRRAGRSLQLGGEGG